ncbi:MAG TPA: permease-like cell division protein FtsX [Candidatus Nanoarchaeia archaeon]|nr:permease-like cell division protein FtsX [Candidatus Nanoarchaeia archaeon]
MFFLSLYRIIKFSLQDLSRNIWLSIVTVIILILALFSINMLLVVKVIGEAAVGAIKDKIDISLYLKTDAPDDQIMALKAQIENLSDVKAVKYVSKEEALSAFQQNNSDDPEILQALRELGKNPLTPTLIIQPKNADSIDNLTHELDRLVSPIIDSRNFTDYQTMLDKINSVTDKVTKAGMILSAIFVLITLMVIFNAIRVAIYTHNMEINIMRLVGAPNSFIYLPFLVSSLFYTLFGLIIIILIFYPFLSLLQPYLEAFFVGYNVNLVDYFNQRFFLIFGGEFIGIALINILASWWAARRYAQA